jgi:3-oxoacyl-[acyl-carrier protein] reductase
MKVLITGGASGLGEAITRAVAGDKNARVFFTYSSSASKAKELEKEFPNAQAIKCDFREEQDVKNLVSEIETLSPDALINNAYPGYFQKSHFHKTPVEEFLSEFKDNVLPTVAITQAAINSFRKKKSGRIITVLTSALVNTPPVGAAVYSANKAYLQELVKVWANENSKFNITSNSISPSFMETNLTKDMDERIVEQIKANHPLKQLLNPADAAGAVLFLLTATPHVNGTDILINAGTSMR